MLDQNTDRMWFVIGAVVIGAAVIFFASGLFDTMLNNVQGQMEDLTEVAGKQIQGIKTSDGAKPPKPPKVGE